MTSPLMKLPHNKAARIGLLLATSGAAVSLAWWIRHGAGWIVSRDLLTFPGTWQWTAAIALLAAASGASLRLGWRNAAYGYGDDAMVFGGIILTVIAVFPILIQGVRYLLWVVLLLVVLAFLFGRRRR